MDTVETFCCGKNWRTFYKPLSQKEIVFKFKPTDDEKTYWQADGFPKLKHLLTFLKRVNKGLDKFEIAFFRGEFEHPYYKETKNGLNFYSVNIDKYIEFSKEVNTVISELKIAQYSRKVWYEYSKKVPEKFMNGEPLESLIIELKNSHYALLEELIKGFDKMNVSQRTELKKVIEHSQVGTEIINEYRALKPDAPKIQLKTFIQVVEKLGEDEVSELLNAILKSKASRYLVKHISELPSKEQNKIVRKIPEMRIMMERHDKLKKSLSEFKRVVKEHKDSLTKDEMAIHKLLTKDYWLLGIEYFDKEIHSDITADGKRTGETYITKRKHADFVIKRMDGTSDTCTIIELEEVNDAIFNKDGTISREVYDGITQAVDYYIEHRSKNFKSKGMAVIGTTQGMRLTSEQKEKLRLLKETFHNIEVLTYDDIINQAENTIRFWETYEANS
ncbi:MAG: Shedu anti-phage system protein SduA domain-containing protein [Candidatus Bathyarchaeia archaeon]|jgi:hypothetical protein